MLARMKGLLFTDRLPEGEGLLIQPCNSIHMIGMRYAIDAVFMDKKGVVVGVLENFAPGRVSSIFFGALSCLELPAGTVEKTGTTIGDWIVSGQGDAPL